MASSSSGKQVEKDNGGFLLAEEDDAALRHPVMQRRVIHRLIFIGFFFLKHSLTASSCV